MGGGGGSCMGAWLMLLCLQCRDINEDVSTQLQALAEVLADICYDLSQKKKPKKTGCVVEGRGVLCHIQWG